MKCKIGIYPFFSAKYPWMPLLAEELEKIFSLPVFYHDSLVLPTDGYDQTRRQYLASRLLIDLCNGRKEPGEIALGITTEDIYERGLNFVFGLATPIHQCAMISTIRLHNSFYSHKEDEQLFFRRLLTEAVHELGHTLGVEHCPDPRCVMHFSNTLADTDRKGYHFCPTCREKINRALAPCR